MLHAGAHAFCLNNRLYTNTQLAHSPPHEIASHVFVFIHTLMHAYAHALHSRTHTLNVCAGISCTCVLRAFVRLPFALGGLCISEVIIIIALVCTRNRPAETNTPHTHSRIHAPSQRSTRALLETICRYTRAYTLHMYVLGASDKVR